MSESFRKAMEEYGSLHWSKDEPQVVFEQSKGWVGVTPEGRALRTTFRVTPEAAWAAMAESLDWGREAWWSEGSEGLGPKSAEAARKRGYRVAKASLYMGWSREA